MNIIQQIRDGTQDPLEVTELDLNNKGLEEIPEEVFQCQNLVGLLLHGNQLRDIPTTIGNLTALVVLFLHRNQLRELPSTIGNLTNLLILYLDENQFQELPMEIGKLEKLRIHGYSELVQEARKYWHEAKFKRIKSSVKKN